MQRLKTQIAKAKRKKEAKRKMSAMIPNISKRKLRLYCCPTITQEKPKLLSSATSEYQKPICSL